MNFYDDFEDSNDYFDLMDGIIVVQALVLHELQTVMYSEKYFLKPILHICKPTKERKMCQR